MNLETIPRSAKEENTRSLEVADETPRGESLVTEREGKTGLQDVTECDQERYTTQHNVTQHNTIPALLGPWDIDPQSEEQAPSPRRGNPAWFPGRGWRCPSSCARDSGRKGGTSPWRPLRKLRAARLGC